MKFSLHAAAAAFALSLTAAAGAAGPTVRTTQIPGGTVTRTYTSDALSVSEEEVLKANGHTLRGYHTILLGNHSGEPGRPWTVAADGKTLFTFNDTMPAFSAVASGGGKTYLLIKGSQGPGETDLVWVADLSGAAVLVSPAVSRCGLPAGSVVDGAYRLVCTRTDRDPAATHTYKDGSFR